MATIHVIPTLNTICSDHADFKSIELAIMNGSRKVGEAWITLINYHKIRIAGKHLDNVARFISEDMHLALSALSKHSLFSCEVLADPDRMYCRVPIICYISRLYIYPEYRGKGYGKACIKMLPEIITDITLSRPLAIAVYICPQTKAVNHNGDVTEMPKADIKKMYQQMIKMFQDAGYVKPSKAMIYKHCLCWTEENK